MLVLAPFLLQPQWLEWSELLSLSSPSLGIVWTYVLARDSWNTGVPW
jgi:hypothetical protein